MKADPAPLLVDTAGAAVVGQDRVKRRRDNVVVKVVPATLLVDTVGACAALGGISRTQLWRIVDSGRLSIVRLPGRTNAETTRRVFYAVDDLRKLISESKESTGTHVTVLRPMPMKKKHAG